MSNPGTKEKAAVFQALHQRDGIFVIPNPWNVGTAKLLTALGFEALATTSAGYSFSQGGTDIIGEMTRKEALSHAREIVESTSLPVSADLENGFGDAPEAVAETVRQAAGVGLMGCTIEDTTGNPDKPLYEKSHAIERIAAGAEAAAGVAHPFLLTARAENHIRGNPDLEDTLERLTGYEAVGADVLYAPGLQDLDAIRQVCAAVSKPVNVVAGIGLKGVTLDDLRRAGVKRVSLGSALARTALGAMLKAAREIKDHGDFSAFESAATFGELKQLLSSASEASDTES